MLLKDKKNAILALGQFLGQFKASGNTVSDQVLHNDLFYDRMLALIEMSQHHNGWFTPEQVYFSLEAWAEALQEKNITQWLTPYNLEEPHPKKVGLILAGNIPLVGFHDLLSVLLTGHQAYIKTSSNDQQLIRLLCEYLIQHLPEMDSYIHFVDGKLTGFDAVIATGSNNSARYFEYYFKDIPAIIRKNRNSVAVLDGTESHEDLVALGEDIFRYFGLGCRNVSKLFVPKDYDFKAFFEAMFTYKDLIEYERYANNYDYNKAVYLMSLFQILDNGFMTLKEDHSYASPISSVFYEYYESLDTVKQKLLAEHTQIQCVVSKGIIENSISFGQTQKPMLWEYADGIDTVAFLKALSL